MSLEMEPQNFLTPTSVKTPSSSSSSSKKEMSSSLRERLRKSSRYFTSPLATPRGTKTARMSPNTSQDAHSNVTASRFDPDALYNQIHNSESVVEVLEITSPAQQEQLLRTTEQTRSSENNGELKTFKKHPILEDKEINLAFETSSQSATAKVGSKSSEPLSVSQVEFLKKEKLQLLDRLAQKEEMLRKLNMVKLYRTKNNLIQLEQLIDRWRQVCQTAIQDLHETLTQPRPPMVSLLAHLQIDASKVGYNAEDDCFE